MVEAAFLVELFSYILLLFLIWCAYRQIQFHVFGYPPGPTGLPFLGSALYIRNQPHKKLVELSKEYGPVFGVYIGPSHAIILCSYDSAKEILTHPSALSRPEKIFDILQGKGGFAGINGEAWQEQRRFCIQAMRSLGLGKGPWEKIIQEDVNEFVEDLASLEGRPTEISEALIRSGTSNNTALLIGRRFTKKKTDPDVQIIEKAHHILTMHFSPTNPVMAVPDILKWFTSFNILGYKEKKKVLDDFAGIFRREVVKRMESEEEAYNPDFIGLYLEELKKHRTLNERHHFSVENLIGHMIVLFFGGSDTTIASIYWLLLIMASHQDVQKKVHQEIDDVIGRDGQSSWDDRRSLPYTMATILEMERWSSITPIFPPRCASETFQYQGYTIPKGSRIMAVGWSINRDPKYWKNPHEYEPERFLQVTGKDASKAEGYAPFSFGKRRCPGETVATMTVFLFFTGIMQKFLVTTASGKTADFDGQFGVVSHPIPQKLCFVER